MMPCEQAVRLMPCLETSRVRGLRAAANGLTQEASRLVNELQRIVSERLLAWSGRAGFLCGRALGFGLAGSGFLGVVFFLVVAIN